MASTGPTPEQPSTAGGGLLIAAPASGSGKTTVTLGLLRAMRRAGHAVRGAKSGPDYIDPRFHAAASGAECVNLDALAMTGARLQALAGGPGLLIVEGAMGLFDGAPPDGRGSSADLARALGLPVVLVVDAAKMAQSVAPLVAGFARHDPSVRIAGVILNRVGSDRHAAMLRAALDPLGLPVLGAVPRDVGLSTPSRHLGLVQAAECGDLEEFLDRAAAAMAAAVDLDALVALAAAPLPWAQAAPRIAPPAQRIAVASDVAFGFAYPHMMADWRAQGAEVLPFSPLADDPVPADAGFVFLPGGYPELHAGRLAAAGRFMGSLRAAAAAGVPVYGECGGYMVLGDGLVDADGTRHAMAGLLRLETSFAARRLHLGYRRVRAVDGPMAGDWWAHEFHYATTLLETGDPLFSAQDAAGVARAPMGLRAGRVAGSFAHVIDGAAG
ncbi:cobyrinate a,c-diamide synthase [Meridianimarinicoccus sp. RP-17]|uniref:cobyrinate a,c-diamide synthase n=1 Tax=Meridianimarinicoccus zhengii TaxID=2056810 RepID=UPI000DACB53D|nr:cobyrinate a,c-diamide synthase [Phycocomes zhengii]